MANSKAPSQALVPVIDVGWTGGLLMPWRVELDVNDKSDAVSG